LVTPGRELDALAFASMPAVVAVLDAVVDGAEGYFCEVGDDTRYWREGVVEKARETADRLLPWATGTVRA